MKVLGIIPARYASTRFPGKPLAQIQGKSMIVRVCEQVAGAGVLDDFVVATDDGRILDHVRDAGYRVYLTSPLHQSGTERCLEALRIFNREHQEKAEAVMNIQGDEPFIRPEQIRKLFSSIRESKAEINTLAKLIVNEAELDDPHIVKVVFSGAMDALYFSRFSIPYLRGHATQDWLHKKLHYKHIGLYGYRAETLAEICSLPPGRLEKAESLEQLRWLENGFRIRVGITDFDSISVDTPGDLLKFTNSA